MCRIWPCSARGETGGVGHSWHLPAWSCSPGGTNTQCQPRRCRGDGPWARVPWCPAHIAATRCPRSPYQRPPNPPYPGAQPAPGLEEQPVRGSQGLHQGAHLWGEGAERAWDLCWHPSPAGTCPSQRPPLIAAIPCWHPSLLAPTPIATISAVTRPCYHPSLLSPVPASTRPC